MPSSNQSFTAKTFACSHPYTSGTTVTRAEAGSSEASIGAFFRPPMASKRSRAPRSSLRRRTGLYGRFHAVVVGDNLGNLGRRRIIGKTEGHAIVKPQHRRTENPSSSCTGKPRHCAILCAAIRPCRKQWVADRDRDGTILGWFEVGRSVSVPDSSRYVRERGA